jgi:hypothetical protein
MAQWLTPPTATYRGAEFDFRVKDGFFPLLKKLDDIVLTNQPYVKGAKHV